MPDKAPRIRKASDRADHSSPDVTTPLVAPHVRIVPTPVPVTVAGQRYAAPIGRHSQRSHERAQARAIAAGCANEKELHAHDLAIVVAEVSRRTGQRATDQQRQQTDKAALPTETDKKKANKPV